MLAALLCGTLQLAACADDADTAARIHVDVESIEIDGALVAVGSSETRHVRITNTARTAPLTVGVRLEYEAPAPGADMDGPALDLVAGNVEDDIVLEPDSELLVSVRYRRAVDLHQRSATLVITSDAVDQPERQVLITVSPGGHDPRITPELVDFGQVKAGEKPKRAITVANAGVVDLKITNMLFQGHPDYTLSRDGVTWEVGEDIQLDPPLLVVPGETDVFDIGFKPLTNVPGEAKVVFYTDDPAHAHGILVEVKANTQGPCIQVNPKKVQFGGKLVANKALLPVEVISCGTAPLDITSIAFKADSNADFGVDHTTLPGFEDAGQPTEETPLIIPVNNQATFNVVYVPSIVSPLGEDGQPIFDEGIVVIQSNAFDAQLEVEVAGLGVDKECPTAVGIIQEGEQVIPQTNLHLFGDQSFAPTGGIISWKWGVQQPTGSVGIFVPSDTFPNPTFETNTAGEYLFSLEVWDEAGVRSCVPWQQTVLVVPDEAIHVELHWHTPDDPDETDQGAGALPATKADVDVDDDYPGADLDLHFTHDKYAQSGPDIDNDGVPDGWFDQPFDAFWFNANPNWGSFDPSIDDDPRLHMDDRDGAGPENLNLNIPENTLYRIGVHYWSDHGYGTSFATVRVYIYSNLVFQVANVELIEHDMWDAATIDWPSGKVTLVQQGGGGYKITPNYQNPFFFQP